MDNPIPDYQLRISLRFDNGFRRLDDYYFLAMILVLRVFRQTSSFYVIKYVFETVKRDTSKNCIFSR